MPLKVILICMVLLQAIICFASKKWLKKFFIRIDGFAGITKQGDLDGKITIGNYQTELDHE